MRWGRLVGNVVKGVVKTGLFAFECTSEAASNAIKNGTASNSKYSSEDYNALSKKLRELNSKIKFDSLN